MADKTASWSSLTGTLELVCRMLDEDAKKSTLLAATEGASLAGRASRCRPSLPHRLSHLRATLASLTRSRAAGMAGPGGPALPSGRKEWRGFCGGGHLLAKCKFRAYPRIWDPSKGSGRHSFVGPKDVAK